MNSNHLTLTIWLDGNTIVLPVPHDDVKTVSKIMRDTANKLHEQSVTNALRINVLGADLILRKGQFIGYMVQ